MKILQVISYFYPAWPYGGPGKLVYDLSKRLTALNHKVTVLSTDAYSENKRRGNVKIPQLKNLNLKIFKNFSNFLAFRFKFFLPLSAYSATTKDLKNYDIIHLHEFFTFYAVTVSYFAHLYKIPYLVSAHGTLDSFHLRHLLFLKRLFMILFGNRIIINADGFIAATPDEIEEYVSLKVHKEKISYIPNGVDLSEFADLPPKGSFRKKIKLASTVKLILYLGRINKLKGLNVLLEAFTKLSEKIDCRLVIAGSDDGYLTEFKADAKRKGCLNSIIFPGILSGREKLEAYTDCDVFMYPSPSEGFSIAVLEAAAAGLPLVITTGCKFPQVAENKAGIIVKPNKNSFFQALLKILTSQRLSKSMGKNARHLVRQNYSIDKMAIKLISCYKNLKS